MVVLCAIALLAVFAGPLVLGKSDDSFAPQKVASTLALLTTIPYLFLLAFDPNYMRPHVRLSEHLGDFELAILRYACVHMLGFLALWLGTQSLLAERIANTVRVLPQHFSRRRQIVAVIVAVSIAAVGFISFLGDVGGLQFLLGNLDRRTELSAGAGYDLALLNTLFFAILIVVYSMRRKRTPGKWVLFFALIVFSALVFSSLGGRKLTIQIVVFSLFAWHYGVRRIKVASWRVAGLFALIVPYFIAVPLLRAPDAFMLYISRPDYLLTEVLNNLAIAVTELSYVDTYVFITSYFDISNVWLGTTYLDLLQAPIPSSWASSKPPVDDGVYVRSLAQGIRTAPGMPYHQLFYSSWPPESLGAMYMNFWLPGVACGMYLLGVAYKSAYRYMERSRFSLYSIVIYAHFVMFFQLSNLRLVQTVVMLTLTTIFFALFFGLRPRRATRSGRSTARASR